MKTRISVKVQPRSSKEEVVRIKDAEYKVFVHAPAVDGKANKKMIELLADAFDLRKHQLRIVTGERSRNKVIEINRSLKWQE